MKLLLVGFGNVGRRLARFLTSEAKRFSGVREADFRVVGVITGRRGSLCNPAGVSLARALREIEAAGRFDPANPEFVPLQALQAAREIDFDVLVELSPLNIEGRGQPAVGWIRAALERGRHVVSANKGPLAFSYRDLAAAAAASGASLLHEATVMDGAPVFNLARHCLRGCRVTQVEGVLNSTTNFALSRIEAGTTLEAAVAEAQRLGFAEADPSLDLDGWDSAAKLCVLANALMGASITPPQVRRRGIRGLDPDEVRQAAASGRRLKLICRAGRSGDPAAKVGPEPVPPDHPFAAVAGTGSILKIATDCMTPIYVSQQRPGLDDTAFGVLGDLLEISRKPKPATPPSEPGA